ncbi:MAG TPA: D-2-hydroxyacid dehydrogenase [Chloroflexota bacterium]|jgi:phosphoglycerate dehydrogenase-like enzyme|nr:D-2-hydroxyacid dehydrogenase [Chloroflexota bacterium]
MDQPVGVLLSEDYRGGEAERIAAVSPRVRLVWVGGDGEPQGDLSSVEVVFRAGPFLPAQLRRLLPRLPRLRWIHTMSAGVDAELVPEIVDSPVLVTRTRGLHHIPVSEWVLMQILAVSKRLPEFVRAQDARRWQPLDVPASLEGRTLGIVGYGEIGQAIARRARGFGFRLVGLRRRPQPAPELDALYGPDGLERLLAEADYVVVVTPLTPATRGLIGAPQLRAMRPTAWLINVGRGPVVDEAALLQALREGWIAGAALDVFDQEPLPADHPLWGFPNVLLTPHNSGVRPHQFRAEIVDQFVANLRRYLAGEPLQHQVDKAAGY